MATPGDEDERPRNNTNFDAECALYKDEPFILLEMLIEIGEAMDTTEASSLYQHFCPVEKRQNGVINGKYPGVHVINFLRSKNIISPRDISKLENAAEELQLIQLLKKIEEHKKILTLPVLPIKVNNSRQHSLLENSLFSFKRNRTLSRFFRDKYNAHYVGCREGCLELRLAIPSTEALEKLRADIQSGDLAKELQSKFAFNENLETSLEEGLYNDMYQQLTSSAGDGGSTSNSGQSFENFVKSLGINLRGKLSLVDGMTIRDSEKISDNALIDFFISKLSSHDYRVYNIGQWFSERGNDNSLNGENNISNEITPDAVEEDDEVLSWLDEVDDMDEDIEQRNVQSSRDVLYGILSCLDPFLLQETLMKLSACQMAVPVLMPQYKDNNHVTFLLWGLRKITKTWHGLEEPLIQTKPVVSHPFLAITALRIGEIGLSKSNVLNKLLGPTQGNDEHAFFISSEQSSSAAIWSQGVLECVWFTPNADSDENQISVPFSLFNLRGDSLKFNKQTEFGRLNSFATIIFVNSEKIQSHRKEIETFKDVSYVILVRCPDKKASGIKTSKKQRVLHRSGVTVINGEGITALEISKLISMALTRVIPSVHLQKRCVLEHTSSVCQDLNIDVDENVPACSSSKQAAEELIELIKADSKENHFRLHTLWKEWTKVDKENVLEQRGKNIEEKISSKNSKKNKLRDMQAKLEPSEAVKHFLKLVTISEKIERNFVLMWIQILLNELSSSTLKPLLAQLSKIFQQKRGKSSKINKLKYCLENEDTSDIKKNLKSELDTLTKEEHLLIEEEKELISNFKKHSIGLEHFIRELGQIAESNVYSNNKGSILNTNYQNLPKLAAELLLEGFPVEILDGDANYVPVSWVQAIIDALVNIIGRDAKVYVFSVLGIKSSGKSTLLNSMFGVRFAVSAERCTRGAYLQLVPVHNSMQEYLKCEYIAIVDTEGLQAPERLVSGNSLEHDNKLATFALCIADLTLINIGGQTMGEGMTNMLEIAAHAFIRMKEVELSSECRIVQQFVAELTAEEKNEIAMQGIFIKLDEAIRNAAKDEWKQNKYRQFSDVFTVQNFSSDSKNVQYIPNLWRGFMSAPDFQYSVKVQLLKSALLCSISNKIGANLTLKEFSVRMSEVWTAIRKENFVFSFHNMTEVSLYEEFMLMYRGWLQIIRVSLMEKQGKIRSKIENAASGKINQLQHESLDEITTFIEKECRKVKDKVGLSFKMEKYSLVNKHSFYFYADLNAFKLNMRSSMTNQLEIYSTFNRNEKIKLVEISSLSHELHEKVFQFAKVFKHTLENVTSTNSKRDVNEIIDEKFEHVWNEWMWEKRQQYQLQSIENIKESTTDVIINTISKDCCRMQLDKHVQDSLEKPLSTFSSSSDNVQSVADVENLELLFNNFDSNLNITFQNIHVEITGISLEHANFEVNVRKVANICKAFVSKPEILAKDALVGFIFAVFLSRTHHFQCTTEFLRFLQNKAKLKEFAKSKGLIVGGEIKKQIQSSLYAEFILQNHQSDNNALIEALERPEDLAKQQLLGFDDSGMISIGFGYVSGFVTNVASKLTNLRQWLESIQSSLPREFEKLEKQYKGNLCTKNCIDIFAQKVVSLCNTKYIFSKDKYQVMSFALKWGTFRFETSFDECLKQYISSKDYTMQFAEPVNASSIEEKFTAMLQLFTEEDLSELGDLKHVLTPQNIEKYSNFPVDVALLQCLDQTFVEMLPTNDTKSLDLIHSVVNKQKKSLLAEKQHFAPFNPSSLSKHITEIISRKEDDVFTNDVKSLAIVHISAWILPVCCVLQYEYERSKNLSILLEKERSLMHVHFRSLCSESQDKLIAETFCNILKAAISDGLNHKLCPLLFVEFLKTYEAFMSKRVFLGTVLKDLCERDDFQGIVDFCKNFKEFSQNWILNYLSTHCNGAGQSLLKIKTDNCVDQLVEDAHSCVTATTEIFQTSNGAFSLWLDIFSQKFLQLTNLPCKEDQISRLKTYLSVYKYELFVSECHRLINAFRKSLKKETCLPKEGNVACTKKFLIDLPIQIHVELFDSLKGCTSQCPFCGAVCDDPLAEHQKHTTVCHFPEGINGRRWRDTQKLSIGICTSSVFRDASYYSKSGDGKYRPFKEYQKDYPDWIIRGVDEQEPNKFWKYIFNTYNSDCASRHNAVEADIPSEWEKITKEEALQSLVSTYNLECE